jgi:MinD superfamily P-loop ATPase
VASGKGGTGKTTVAVNLALSVQPSVYVDCDVEEPNGHILLKPTMTSQKVVAKKFPKVDLNKCTFCGKCSKFCEFNAIVVLKTDVMILEGLCHGCGVCSYFCPEQAIGEIEKSTGVIRKGTVPSESVHFIDGVLNIGETHGAHLIRRVRKEISAGRINIIDAPPGTSCSMVASVKDADYCVLVTESTPFGLNDLKLAIQVVRSLNIPFGIIINKYDERFKELDEYCRDEDISILLKIPFDRKIAEYYSRGAPLINVIPHFKASLQQVFKNIQLTLQPQVARVE